MRLRMPRWASRWFIGTLAWPSGRATTSGRAGSPGGPTPPPRHDVEGEAGGVLVELPHERVDLPRVEPGPGQGVERRDDAGVLVRRRCRSRRAPRRAPGRSRCRRTSTGRAGAPRRADRRPGRRSASRLTCGSRKTIAERLRWATTVAATARPPEDAGALQDLTDAGAHDGAHRHLLRPQPQRADRRARERADRPRSGAGPLRGPAPRGGERRAHGDALPQCRDLVLPLADPGHGLGRGEPGRPGQRPRGDCPASATRGQCGPGEAADGRGESGRGSRAHLREPSARRTRYRMVRSGDEVASGTPSGVQMRTRRSRRSSRRPSDRGGGGDEGGDAHRDAHLACSL